MDQKTIALELLVRSGNSEGVKKFSEAEGLDESLKTDKLDEAGVYSAIKFMSGEESGCGIDSDRVCGFLGQEQFTRYFSRTQNTELILDLLDVLESGTHVNMEAYAQITPFDVFGMDSVSGALRRFSGISPIRKKLTQLANSGYSLVFCPHDIDSEMVEHYFPLVDRWRDLVNPQEIVERTIEGFAEDAEELFEYNKDFAYTALEKLILLSDRATVSRLAQEHFGDSEQYEQLVRDGKIDAYIPQLKGTAGTGSVSDSVQRAVMEYEKQRFPSEYDARDLAEKIGEDGKVFIAGRMGQWFRRDKLLHLEAVANYDNGRLYDYDTAKKSLGEAIAESCEQGNLRRLEWVLKLPNYVIDDTNPAISGVVTAYKLSKTPQEE